MSSLNEIVETGSFTSKARLNEVIASLEKRAKLCRERLVRGTMSVQGAADEIYACNNWIECFIEMRDDL